MSIALRKQGKAESFPLEIGGVAAERRNGRGATTNGCDDNKPADVILAMRANPAENHPVGFKSFIEAKTTPHARYAAE